MTHDPTEESLQAAREAVSRAGNGPQRFDAGLRLAECLLQAGEVAQAREAGDELEAQAGQDPLSLARVGGFHTACSRFEAAHRCHLAALALRPGDSRLAYNAASSAVAVGDIDEAERLFERVIALDPDDHDAWQNRSTLRTWSEERNHVDELGRLAASLPSDHPGRAPVCYALAKELEDLGRHEAAFAWLQRGAAARRRRLDYDVGADVATLARLADVFDADWLAGSAAPAESGPLFILGLPRSGTTLTDRMLSGHDSVASLGEVSTLAMAVTRLAGEGDRTTLVTRAAHIDPVTLGAAYLRGTRAHGVDAPWLIDKTPLNFLYLGLLRRALPGAKVVHLRRHPLDSCYAIYKTLFRMGYPFSYSLQDVGRYYLAYHRLMGHWRRNLGGFFLDVDYEALVDDPETQVRRMLDFTGLDWDPACLAPERRDTPAATASAAQVRRPVYRSSVGRWRCYERQLAPLAGKLREGGVPL